MIQLQNGMKIPLSGGLTIAMILTKATTTTTALPPTATVLKRLVGAGTSKEIWYYENKKKEEFTPTKKLISLMERKIKKKM